MHIEYPGCVPRGWGGRQSGALAQGVRRGPHTTAEPEAGTARAREPPAGSAACSPRPRGRAVFSPSFSSSSVIGAQRATLRHRRLQAQCPHPRAAPPGVRADFALWDPDQRPQTGRPGSPCPCLHPASPPGPRRRLHAPPPACGGSANTLVGAVSTAPAQRKGRGARQSSRLPAALTCPEPARRWGLLESERRVQAWGPAAGRCRA